MAKFTPKYRKKLELGGQGGYSTPEGTFDANGNKIAGPNGQPLSGGANYAGMVSAGLSAVNTYQNSGNSAEGTKGAIDAVAGYATPWYGYAKQASNIGRSYIPKDENGIPIGSTNKQLDQAMKPQHEMVIDDASKGNYGLAAAESFIPGIGMESKSNALGMQKGINKFFGSNNNNTNYNKFGGNMVGGRIALYDNGGKLVEYQGADHEQGGIPVGNSSEVEGGENQSNGIVNSKSYKYNKNLVKGLLSEGIDITKHMGKTPAQAARIEDKRYPREDDMFTKNALKQEERNGTGKYAVENASKLVGDAINQSEEQGETTSDNEVNEQKYGGIHIKPSHEGRFTAYKARTGKTTEEAMHSSDPHVRQMANFANNAKHWKHEFGGDMNQGFVPYNEFWDRKVAYLPSETQKFDIGGKLNLSNSNENLDMNDYYNNIDPNMQSLPSITNQDLQNRNQLSSINTLNTTPIQQSKSFDIKSSNDTGNFDYSRAIGTGANMLGSLYDIGRGIKGGAKVNYDRVTPSTVDYSSSKAEALRSNNQTYKGMTDDIKNVNSPAMAQALKFQASGKKYQSDSDTIAKFDEMQKNTNAGIWNQSKYANAATQRAEADARQAEKDVASNTLQTGLSGLGTSIAGTTRDQGLYVSQEDAKKYIGSGDFVPFRDENSKEVKGRYLQVSTGKIYKTPGGQ